MTTAAVLTLGLGVGATAAQIELGRAREARETVRRLLETEPGLTVSAFRARYPGRDTAEGERFMSALEAAGLPA